MRKCADIKLMANVPITMRDGAILYANVYRPDDDERYPAVVLRTPYLKESVGILAGYIRPQDLSGQGYNVVLQDVRGAGWSEGVCDPSGHQVEDGYDTVEAVAAMPWCDGNVGMVGESYCGFSQLAAAQGRPPHLRAICPFQTSWTKFPAIYSFGVFSNVLYGWIYGRALDRHEKFGILSPEAIEEMQYCMAHGDEQVRFLPLKDMPAANIPGVPGLDFQNELLENIANEDFLAEIGRAEGYDKVEVPCLILTGWYDFLRDKSIYNYTQFKTRGGSEKCREGGKLIVGPWLHGDLLSGGFDGFYFGPEGSGEGADITGRVIDWFDCWMKGETSPFMSGAPVKLFILGPNIWRDEYEWPLARTQYTNYYLHSGGKANSLDGDGTLSARLPEDEREDHYLYDPGNPVYTHIDDPYTHMVQDQRPNERRGDVLVYTTGAFEQDTEITGPITADLFVSSTAIDTDFVCKVSEVYPDGRALNIAMILVRARYRNGHEPEFLEPGKAYEVHFDIGNIGMILKQGHKIRLDVTSSLFPDADLNMNTGGRVGYETEYNLAVQTILHDSDHPSRLVLPIIPK
jgi:uncharacterized protein